MEIILNIKKKNNKISKLKFILSMGLFNKEFIRYTVVLSKENKSIGTVKNYISSGLWEVFPNIKIFNTVENAIEYLYKKYIGSKK